MGLSTLVRVVIAVTLFSQAIGIYVPRETIASREAMDEGYAAQQPKLYSNTRTADDYYSFLEALGRLYYARGRRSRQDTNDQGEFTRMYRNPDFLNNHAEAIMRGLG